MKEENINSAAQGYCDAFKTGIKYYHKITMTPTEKCSVCGMSKPIGEVHWQGIGFMHSSLK